MWPAPCDYHRARTVAEAVELLATLPSARVLAGGLSLVPAMRRRRVRPAHLVDINGVLALSSVVDETVGATCGQETVRRWAFGRAPLLADALAHVGTAQTRQRGTVAGIVANGDPVTQLAAVCAVLGATAVLRDRNGERELPAADVFAAGGVADATLLAALRFPAWPPGDGHAFVQTGRRAVGATVGGVAARVRVDGTGTCVRADVAPFVLGHDGACLPRVADRLVGTNLTGDDIAAAADLAAAHVDTATDVLATADYRTHLVRVLVRRAVTQAVARTETQMGATA